MGGTAEERLRAGLVLQHEAYRDGVESGDKEAETLRAVTGHSEMAKRMLLEGSYAGAILSDMNLMTDLYYLHQGADVFASYAGAAYDSSADYWLLTENGKMKSGADGWLRDSNGDLVLDATGKPIGADDKEKGLINILQHYGVNSDELAVSELLNNAGIMSTSDFSVLGKEVLNSAGSLDQKEMAEELDIAYNATIDIRDISGVDQKGWDTVYTGVLGDLTKKIFNGKDDPLNLYIPNYSDDGCMARRAIISDYLQDNGFDMGKAVQVDFVAMMANDYDGKAGSEYARVPNNKWVYHTAASTEIGDQRYVIDYIGNPSNKLLTEEQWRKMYYGPRDIPVSNTGSSTEQEFNYVDSIPDYSSNLFRSPGYSMYFYYSDYMDFSRKFLDRYKEHVDRTRP